jgi:hypothetical protein
MLNLNCLILDSIFNFDMFDRNTQLLVTRVEHNRSTKAVVLERCQPLFILE